MASKRHQRRKQCEGKNRHATYWAAKAEWVAMMKAGKDARNMNIYHCSFCSAFHVGHTPHKIRAAQRARQEGSAWA